MQDYRVKCLNNLATTQVRLEQFDEALHTSRDVLTLEPNNVKALFRVGKVRMYRQCVASNLNLAIYNFKEVSWKEEEFVNTVSFLLFLWVNNSRYNIAIFLSVSF